MMNIDEKYWEVFYSVLDNFFNLICHISVLHARWHGWHHAGKFHHFFTLLPLINVWIFSDRFMVLPAQRKKTITLTIAWPSCTKPLWWPNRICRTSPSVERKICMPGWWTLRYPRRHLQRCPASTLLKLRNRFVLRKLKGILHDHVNSLDHMSFFSPQHSSMVRDRSGVGHAPVKRRKLISNASMPGCAGQPLMRQGSCGGQSMTGGAQPRPSVGAPGGPTRHYRAAVPSVKVSGTVVSACQTMDRERSGLAVQAPASAVSTASSAGQGPPSAGPATTSTTAASTMPSSERLSSTAQVNLFSGIRGG